MTVAGGVAFAQEAELEEIIVTGSRIPRPDFESASPVVTIGADRFLQNASASVETTLRQMPQFVGYLGANTNFELYQGQAQVSLRGLGSTATLTLIEGRRIVPANGNGVPDMNLIPPSLVQRVEVLTGGASAVYGSDALAGVVNFHLLDEYEGLEFSGDWGVTGQGDAETYTIGVTGGASFAEGRGSLMGYVGYSRRAQLVEGDRRFSRVYLTYDGPGTEGVGPGGQYVIAGSSSIEEGRANFSPSRQAFDTLFAGYGYPAGTVPFQGAFGFNDDGTLFTRGNGQPQSVANFRGARDPVSFSDRTYVYNFATFQNLQLPLERSSGFLNGHLEIGDTSEIYGQALIGDYNVENQLAPAPVPLAYIPVTNPFIPPDLRFLLDSRVNPAAPFRFAKRTLETGPRVFENDYRTWQATLGVRGDFLEDWRYDGYVQYGQSDQTVTLSGAVNVLRFEELLGAADGGLAACGGMNPFGKGSISARCADSLAVKTINDEKIQELTAEFSIEGPLVHLPAGELTAVFGLFYKDDRYSLRPDDLLDDFLPDGRQVIVGSTWGPQGDVDGDDHNLDVYFEALIPVLSDVTAVRRLETVLGYRYSDYASAGGTSTYKAELLYEPVDAVRFRGSFQHAVRAPSVYQLYNPWLITDWTLEDPCSVGSDQRAGPDGAAVEALCVEQGVPAELMGSFTGEPWEGFQGGNPALEPETANTYTVGVVFTSPWATGPLRSLQASLDWYDIHITDAIVRYWAAWFVPNCYDRKFNPRLEVSNRYCGYFSRDLEIGSIVDAYEIDRNSGGLQVSGIDVDIDWRHGLGPGEIGVSWLVSWMDSWEFQDDPESKPRQWVGTGCCSTLPRWKWNLDGRYQVGGATIDVVWEFLGSFRSWEYPEDDIDETSYVNLVGAYEFSLGPLRGLTLRAGINNLFDRSPPIFASHAGANTDPAVFDVLGRRYFVGVNYRLRPGEQ